MTDQSPHIDEYDDAMVALLELVWGKGFMAPGGAPNVRKLVAGLDMRGKTLLDIGCGIGGGGDPFNPVKRCHAHLGICLVLG